MSGDVWEYLILATVVWFLARRLRRPARAPEPPPDRPAAPAEQPWWDKIP